MNAASPLTTKVAPSTEDIVQQLEALRADLMKLASTVTDDVSEGIGKAGRQIGQTGRDARTAATTTVLDHPLAAIGIAAGLGLLIGLVARRG
jgi:ElaB/YqjD/DUF883 family membrane-anchored ribosome-binding protein